MFLERGMLLLSAAEKLATELGVESGFPRIYDFGIVTYEQAGSMFY